MFLTHSFILLYTPQYQSTIKCIQLLAVMKSFVLQMYGAACVLENFVKDINKLEQVRTCMYMYMYYA